MKAKIVILIFLCLVTGMLHVQAQNPDNKPVPRIVHVSSIWDEIAEKDPPVEAGRTVRRAANQNRKYRKGIDKEKVEYLVGKMDEIVDAYPHTVRVFSPLIKLNVLLGRYDEAVSVSQKGLKRIREMGLNIQNEKNERPALFEDMKVNYITHYDGKVYMDIALSYAVMCDMNGGENVDAAYKYALNVIDERICLKDIGIAFTVDDGNEMYRQLMAEKQILAAASITPGVTLNSSERSAIFNHGWVTNETMRTIDEKIKEGKIDNPRIRQINTQLKEMRENQHKMGKDSLYLYGLRAMVIDLSEGQPALNHYVDSMLQCESVGAKLKSYLSKLMKNRQKHAAVLEDREAVVRSLAEYAPINKGGDSKEERKQRAKEFYKYRDSMKAVYPLEWLWKQ